MVRRFEHDMQPTDTTTIDGDRATLVDSYVARLTPPRDLRAALGAGVLSYRGEPPAWHAELRHDRTGWRLSSVTIPPWCGSYSRWGATSTAPAPAATPS